MPSKSELRQHFRNLRNSLSKEQQVNAALNLKEKLQEDALIQKANKIGIYLAIKNELSLEPSIKILQQQGKQLFAPILHPQHQTFWFAPLHESTKENKFGIKEPIYQLEDLLAPWELDLILVPALSIDQHKHRLGMGMGYYDRSLAFKKTNPNSKPYLIACVHACQVSKENLPTDDLDITMDEIIST